MTMDNNGERLPLEYPTTKALWIYSKRLFTFFLVVAVNLAFLVFLMLISRLFNIYILRLLVLLLPAVSAFLFAVKRLRHDTEERSMDKEETDIHETIYSMVLEKLEKISDKKRKAIVEVILLGRSYDEVAMEEGVTPNTVRYRVEDGIRELNREFKRLANMNPTLDAEIKSIYGYWR